MSEFYCWLADIEWPVYSEENKYLYSNHSEWPICTKTPLIDEVKALIYKQVGIKGYEIVSVNPILPDQYCARMAE